MLPGRVAASTVASMPATVGGVPYPAVIRDFTATYRSSPVTSTGLAGWDPEGQAKRLARSVIRVLPEDHGPSRPERGQAERGEDVAGERTDLGLWRAVGDERIE